ncbi:MAG: histidinol-phosphate transaminase [Bacteroidetes bacterium]|nr:histidinol-phosphate transaminase [Bacteroidota bacterium]MCW5896181.1 histidinol-phosphate transaminase [Bacteroidota bacterium]
MSLVPPYIETLEPYKAGKPISELQRELGLTDIIKLASNENPLGPSPLALEEMKNVLNDLHYYPNGGLDLREVLAGRFDVQLGNVIVDAGSEGIMSSIIRTFLCDDDEVLTSEGTFVGLYVLVKSRGVKLVTVPLKEYHFNLPAIAAAITPRTKIIYLANPNNPTGTIFTTHEFDEFMKHVPPHVLIILDEAYFEYAKDNPKYPDSMHYRYDNVITLRTFSKVYGLAGIRIGYGFAHDTLITNLLKVKLPFEPSTLAQAAGIGALRDSVFVHRSLEVNAEGMKYIVPELKNLGFTVLPSDANFVMCPMESPAAVTELYNELLKLGVIIRPLPAFRLPHCIRITIGTMAENERLIRSLKTIKLSVPV